MAKLDVQFSYHVEKMRLVIFSITSVKVGLVDFPLLAMCLAFWAGSMFLDSEKFFVKAFVCCCC